jgi:tRNA (guanine9-N1)-methyltransferase
VSLVSQCAYCYSSNRKSQHPFTSLLFTSLNGRTYRRLEDMKTYRQWKNVEWWDQGYEGLWRSEDALESREPLTPSREGHAEPSNSSMLASKVSPCHPSEGTVFRPETQRSHAPKSSVVYLTADSPDELLELKEGETYIIGGICDKNRYKVSCLILRLTCHD